MFRVRKNRCPPTFSSIWAEFRSQKQLTSAIVDFVFLGPSQNPQLHYSEVNLPNEIDVFTSDEQRCFSQERVYWPPDGNCYPLLQQGPCRIGEWLVVSETISSRLVSFNSLICKSKFMKRKYSWHLSYYYLENLFDQNLKFKNKIHTHDFNECYQIYWPKNYV